jgi:hypothetical protein
VETFFILLTVKIERRATMKRDIRCLAKLLLFGLIISIAFLAAASNLWAENGGTLKKQVQGNWMLVSIYNEVDGKKIDVFGTNPRGSMILTPDGRFSIIIMRASLPKFASNNRIKGTTEEYQAIVQGSVAYFGSYKVANEQNKTVSLKIEGCTFPNWDGEDQARVMEVTGDEMKLTNPTAAVGGKNYLIWKKIK